MQLTQLTKTNRPETTSSPGGYYFIIQYVTEELPLSLFLSQEAL